MGVTGKVTGLRCPVEVAPGCGLHTPMDKWQSCLVRALFADPEEQTGSVDGFGMWVGLNLIHDAVTLEDTWGPVHVPANTFMLIGENNSGHISVVEFSTAEAAQEAFDDFEADYAAYLHGVETREYTIVSSTGRTGR